MIKPRHSLRTRLALAFALLGGCVALALAALLFLAFHNLNQRLIDESLRAETEDYIARRDRNPLSLPPTTVSIRGFVANPPQATSDVPAPLAALAPGSYQIRLDGVPYHVAVMDRGEARYWMLFNEVRQRHREQRFLLMLALGVVTMMLFSAVGGWWLSGRITASMTRLAQRVGKAAPGGEALLLEESFPDNEPEDEVGALARAFERYSLRIGAFIERERAFTADVSHELRTPLAVIQGAAEVLQGDEHLNEWQQVRLDRIERAARETGVLIAALLALAREEAGSGVSAADCDAASVAREAVEKLRYLTRGRAVGVALDIQASPVLAAEKVLFAIVVENLLRNALVFTEHGAVTLRVETGRITVTDTGQGIRAGDLAQIFQRHYKGAGSQGAGIGLSLVRRICDRYGWEIAIESREGVGTVAALVWAPT
jgi:signal transduction histidine kinase